MKNKKKLIAVLIAAGVVLLLLAAVIIVQSVRRNRPPDLETLRPRIEALVASSYEVNDILFGDGLPTYPRIVETTSSFTIEHGGDEYTLYYSFFPDETHGTVIAYQYYIREKATDGTGYTYYDVENGVTLSGVPTGGARRYARKSREAGDDAIYHTEAGDYYYALTDYSMDGIFFYTATDEPYYDYVRTDCGYLSIDDIKKRAAQVYSAAYLNSVGESIFTGVTVSDRDSGTLYARYLDHEDSEGNYSLMKSNTQKGLIKGKRIYDFSTMRMVKPSNARRVTVEVESYMEGSDERLTVRLSLALENGQWFLDSPTY